MKDFDPGGQPTVGGGPVSTARGGGTPDGGERQSPSHSRPQSLMRGRPMLMRATSGSSRRGMSLTKDRERLARTLRASNLSTSVLCGLTRDNRLRRVSISIALSRWFEIVTACMTLAYAVVLALYAPLDAPGTLRSRVAVDAAPVFAALFTLEAAIKIVALGLTCPGGYLRDVWNVMDSCVLAVAWAAVWPSLHPKVAGIVLVRLLNALRVLPSMSVFLDSLISTAAALRNVLLLTFLSMSLFSLLAVQVWAGTLGGACGYTHPTTGDLVLLDAPIACALPCEAQGGSVCRVVDGDACPLINVRVPGHPLPFPVQSSCVATPDTAPALTFDTFPQAMVTAFVMMTTEGFSDMTYYLWHAFGSRVFVTLAMFTFVITSHLVVLELALAVTFSEFRAAKEAEQRRLLIMCRHVLDFYSLLTGGMGGSRTSGIVRASIGHGAPRSAASSMPRLSLETPGGRGSVARASLRLSLDLLTSVQSVRASRGLAPRASSMPTPGVFTGASPAGGFAASSSSSSSSGAAGVLASEPHVAWPTLPGGAAGRGGVFSGGFDAIPEEGEDGETAAGSSGTDGEPFGVAAQGTGGGLTISVSSPASGGASTHSGHSDGERTSVSASAWSPGHHGGRPPHRLPPIHAGGASAPSPAVGGGSPPHPVPTLAAPPVLTLQQSALRRASTRVLGGVMSVPRTPAPDSAGATVVPATTVSPPVLSPRGAQASDSFVIPAPTTNRIPVPGSRLARYVSASIAAADGSGGGGGGLRSSSKRSGVEWDPRAGWRDSTAHHGFTPGGGMLSPRSVRFGLSPAALQSLTKGIARRMESNAALVFSPATDKAAPTLTPATPHLLGRSRMGLSTRHLARSIAMLEHELQAAAEDEDAEEDEFEGGDGSGTASRPPPLTAIPMKVAASGPPGTGSSPVQPGIDFYHMEATVSSPPASPRACCKCQRQGDSRQPCRTCPRRAWQRTAAAFKRGANAVASAGKAVAAGVATAKAAVTKCYDACPPLPPSVRTPLLRVVAARPYHLAQVCLIVGHAGVLGAWYSGMTPDEEQTLRLASLSCVAAMLLALLLEVAAFSIPVFFRGEGGGFRSFDAILTLLAAIDAVYDVVVPSSIGTADALANGLRVMRLLSCLRVIGCIHSLTRVATQLGSALPTALSLMLVFLMVVFLFGVMGLHVFGGGYDPVAGVPRSNFNTLWSSLVTAFQIVDGENFDSLVSVHVQAFGPWASVFFIVAMLVGQILVLNVFIALFLHNFETTDTRGAEAVLKDTKSSHSPKEGPRLGVWKRAGVAVRGLPAQLKRWLLGGAPAEASAVSPRPANAAPPSAVVTAGSGGTETGASSPATTGAPTPPAHAVRPDIMWRVSRAGEPYSVTATIASLRAYPYEDEVEGELLAGMGDEAMQLLAATRPLLRIRVNRLGDVHVHPFARAEYEQRFGAVSGAEVARLAAATAASAATATSPAVSVASRRGSLGGHDGPGAGGSPWWDPERGWVMYKACAPTALLPRSMSPSFKPPSSSLSLSLRGRRGSGANNAASGRYAPSMALVASPSTRRPSLPTDEGSRGDADEGDDPAGSMHSYAALGGGGVARTRLQPILQQTEEEEEEDDDDDDSGNDEAKQEHSFAPVMPARNRNSARRSAKLSRSLAAGGDALPAAVASPQPAAQPVSHAASHSRRLPPIAMPAAREEVPLSPPSASPPDSDALSVTSSSTGTGRRSSFVAAVGASVTMVASKLPWSSRRGSFLGGGQPTGPGDTAVDDATSEVFRSPDNRRSERVVWGPNGRVRRFLSGTSSRSLGTATSSGSGSDFHSQRSGFSTRLQGDSLRTVSRWIRASARLSFNARHTMRGTSLSWRARASRRWNSVRNAVSLFVYSPWFSRASLAVVLWSSVNLALDEPTDGSTSGQLRAPDSDLSRYLSVSELIIACAFGLECVLQMIARGLVSHRRSYLRSPWRVMDLFAAGVQVAIVALSAVSVPGENDVPLRILRAARALRSLRVVSFFPGLRIVVNALAVSVPELVRLAGLLFVGVYTFAVIGLHTFAGRIQGCNDPAVTTEAACTGTFALTGPLCALLPSAAAQTACRSALLPPQFPRLWSSRASNFDSIGRALLTVMELVSGENWPAEWGPSDGNIRLEEPAVPLYFILAELVLNMLLLEIIAGAIVETYRRLRDNARGVGWLAPQQRTWVANLRLIVLARPANKLRPPTAVVGIAPSDSAAPAPARTPPWRSVRQRVFKLVVSPWFDRATNAVSLLAFIHLALRTAREDAAWVDAYAALNAAVVGLMVLQLCLEAVGLGHTQLWSRMRSRWDMLLCLLAIPSLVLPVGLAEPRAEDNLPLARAAAAIHAIQVLRATRILHALPGTKRVVEGLARAAPRILNVAVVLAINYFMWAVIGLNLFSGLKQSPPQAAATVTTNGYITPDANFDSFPLALVTIIRCSVGENAPGLLLYSTAPSPPYCDPGTNCGLGFGVSIAYFIAFFLVTTTVLVGLLSAVLIESFDASGLHEARTDGEGDGLASGTATPGAATPGGAGGGGGGGGDFRLHRRHVAAYTAAWDVQDVQGEGALPLEAAARVVAALAPPLGTLVPPPPPSSSMASSILQARRDAAAAASVTRAVRMVYRLPIIPDARGRVGFHALLQALVERACAAQPLAGEVHAIITVAGVAKSAGYVLRDVSAAKRIQCIWRRFKRRVDACEAELLAEAGLAAAGTATESGDSSSSSSTSSQQPSSGATSLVSPSSSFLPPIPVKGAAVAPAIL